MMKIVEGAWVPLAIAISLMLVMLTWLRGTTVLNAMVRKDADLQWLVRTLEKKPPHRVNGTAVFLTATPDAAPSSLLHNLKHNHMLHERNILLTIKTADVPHVPNSERVKIESLSDMFIGVTLTYGFMETPSVEKGLQLCRRHGLNVDPAATSFFLSRRTLRRASRSQMRRWQEKLFIWLPAAQKTQRPISKSLLIVWSSSAHRLQSEAKETSPRFTILGLVLRGVGPMPSPLPPVVRTYLDTLTGHRPIHHLELAVSEDVICEFFTGDHSTKIKGRSALAQIIKQRLATLKELTISADADRPW